MSSLKIASWLFLGGLSWPQSIKVLCLIPSTTTSPDLNLTPLAAFLRFLPSTACTRCARQKRKKITAREVRFQELNKHKTVSTQTGMLVSKLECFYWLKRVGETGLAVYRSRPATLHIGASRCMHTGEGPHCRSHTSRLRICSHMN